MRMVYLSLAIVLVSTGFAHSETMSAYGFCSRDEASGWYFYCDPPKEPDPEPEQERVEEAIPPSEPPAPKTATEEIMDFRKMADELKHRAVLNPTSENVQAYMEVNKKMAEMAAAFTDQWQRVLFSTPHLDANVTYPLTAKGVTIYQDQMAAAQKTALLKAASTQGLLFVFESAETCGVCEAQAEILAAMREVFSVQILAVSADGSTSKFFPEAVTDQGQLKQLGLDELPRPLIALVEPKESTVQLVGAGLLTEDQILERIYTITAVPIGTRYGDATQ